jgi:predicted ester cyclase
VSSNTAALQALHEAFNSRNWSNLVDNVAEDCHYTGADGTEYHGKEGFLAAAQQWTKAFSDGQVTEPRYYDAGNTVISEFVGRGTHDGTLGSFQPTRRQATFPMVEVYHFNDRNQIIGGRSYTDQLSILRQLGIDLGPIAT